MEKELYKLMAQMSFLAVLIWVLASAFGRRAELKVARHPGDRKLDPQSPVWQHSHVRGPMASPMNAVGVSG